MSNNTTKTSESWQIAHISIDSKKSKTKRMAVASLLE